MGTCSRKCCVLTYSWARTHLGDALEAEPPAVTIRKRTPPLGPLTGVVLHSLVSF